jgi:hypothetical protein
MKKVVEQLGLKILEEWLLEKVMFIVKIIGFYVKDVNKS